MSDRSRELDELLEHGYRFALSLTHDEARADDLLQDAWFAILRARGPWHRGYLFTAIRSQFVDHCRRNQRAFAEPLDPGSIEQENATSCCDDADELVSAVNGTVEKALSRLKSEERAVLFLAIVGGHTAAEIAELLGWPRGTVLSRLHRSRNKLRRYLESESGPLT